MVSSLKQCAVLVGGLGTRLGALTKDTPKPLLSCGDRPFLAWVLRELCRYGITEVVLLAGYKSARVEAFCQEVQNFLPKSVSIKVSIEATPLGTGGAVLQAADLLDETFLLINGDSWFDTNLARLLSHFERRGTALGCMLLRQMEDCARYGTVELSGDSVRSFQEKSPIVHAGTINSGIYALDKRILSWISGPCSLETDVLPVLAQRGLLCGEVADGYFIDIGIPDDYQRAHIALPAHLKRPAVFFDRDGVLNQDYGWVGSIERFEWTEGAREAIRLVNDQGYHAFMVTNQAGVAKGYYGEEDVGVLHAYMQDELRRFGACLEDIRYCPYHPEAKIERYRRNSDWRKPAPGMILDLAEKWQIDLGRSFLIGDKDSDIAAAEAANIRGYRYAGGRLDDFANQMISPVI